jgi:hypothetical protein
LETAKGCKDYLGLWITWQRSREEVEAANAHIASCDVCRQHLPGLVAGPLLEHSPHEMARALARFSQMAREQGFEQAVHDNSLAASYLAAEPAALTRYQLSQKLLATGVGRDTLPAEVQQVLHRHFAPAGRFQWRKLRRRLAALRHPSSVKAWSSVSSPVKLKAAPLSFLAGVTALLSACGRRLAERFRPVPAFAFVTVLLVLGLVGVGGTIVTLREQNQALVKQLDVDGPVAVGFSPVGQRTLQLHLRLYPDTVQEIFVDWGDLTDPLGGTRVYPAAGGKVAPGIRVADGLLLPPITHEYPVPHEGVRTAVRIRIVPAVFQGERPKSPSAPIRFSSEANLTRSRSLWLLPHKIVVDPPEIRRGSLYQRQQDGVPMDEQVESGLLQKLNDARGYLEGGSPNGSEEALRLYQAVLGQLSPGALQQLNQELLDAANNDAQAGYIDQAARKYRALFGAYQPRDP